MKFYKRNKFIGMQEPMISYILCILDTTQASPPTPIENRKPASCKTEEKNQVYGQCNFITQAYLLEIW